MYSKVNKLSNRNLLIVRLLNIAVITLLIAISLYSYITQIEEWYYNAMRISVIVFIVTQFFYYEWSLWRNRRKG